MSKEGGFLKGLVTNFPEIIGEKMLQIRNWRDQLLDHFRMQQKITINKK